MTSSKVITSKNQNGVQSLEIGLSILDVLIDNRDPMMLKDVAKAMDMHPSKAHRYLVSLIRKNYACQLTDGRYKIGARVNALAYTGLNQSNIFERLTHIANEIRDVLNCGVQISKWFSEGPVIIQFIEPDSPINIMTRIGSRMPLSTSATGQLFASYQSQDIIKPLLFTEWQHNTHNAKSSFLRHAESSNEEVDLSEVSEKWVRFTKLQDTIRQQGYNTVAGTLVKGINAISIPIFMSQSTAEHFSAEDGVLEYAITIIGTSEQLPITEQHQVADEILKIIEQHQIF